MKSVYFFGLNNGNISSESASKFILGGKGYGLYHMSNVGIAVPPGFIISTVECNEYQKSKVLSQTLKNEVDKSMLLLENFLSKSFYNSSKDFSPLLLSVRSGAPVSMPGMMDTVLNVGMNDETVDILAHKTQNTVFAYDSYRRFIEMYTNVVLSQDSSLFDTIFKSEFANKQKNNLNPDELKKLIDLYKLELKKSNLTFPQDKKIQLYTTIEKIFQSWRNDRAIKYREIYKIPDSLGTAVIVQSMVFGNFNDKSGTGVLFSRDPSNGNNVMTGEYLVKAQGEDIVSGSTTPMNLKELHEKLPNVYKSLEMNVKTLEKMNKDIQDVEFTVEDENLWILQTRSAKRTSKAAVKAAFDMISEGLISKEEGLMRIDRGNFAELFHKTFTSLSKQEELNYPVLSTGLPASVGCAAGMVVLDSDLAEKLYQEGKRVILVREETSPEDINGMHNSEGILTAKGGMTSHAAVIARGFGKPCVCGSSDLHINYEDRKIKIKNHDLNEFDFISINGATGQIFKGDRPMTKESKSNVELSKILDFAREFVNFKIRINAENSEDLATGLSFSRDGIGLLRTEHMFFEKNRLLALRKLIVNQNEKDISEYLEQISRYHKEDFVSLFKMLDGLPVNIRLLDPPLHEFLPLSKYEIRKLSKSMSISYEDLKSRVEDLKEVNPMMGCRGVRVGILHPQIYDMEIRVIFEAYIESIAAHNKRPCLEIMIPLVICENELLAIKSRILQIKLQVEEENGISIAVKIGTMIETPAACLSIKGIAPHVDYLSFGTNDLTQATLSMSRDDYSRFIERYKEIGIVDKDPFVSLCDPVKEIIKLAIQDAKLANPKITWSMCGEHAGDVDSVKFAIDNNFSYLSCSPYRIPSIIIAGAQEDIKSKM